jgi:hypothetical protein
MPKQVAPPLLCRYVPGMKYGAHADAALLQVGGSRLRSDLSCTVFVNDPASYEGGELSIEIGNVAIPFKGAAGEAIVYPSTTLHEVVPVRAGERLVSITCIESHIPSSCGEGVSDLDIAALEGLTMMGKPRPPRCRAAEPDAHVVDLGATACTAARTALFQSPDLDNAGSSVDREVVALQTPARSRLSLSCPAAGLPDGRITVELSPDQPIWNEHRLAARSLRELEDARADLADFLGHFRCGLAELFGYRHRLRTGEAKPIEDRLGCRFRHGRRRKRALCTRHRVIEAFETQRGIGDVRAFGELGQSIARRIRK